ncbi:hypothetical protein [Saccharopolyspora spinosa]|uniref:hypothetical protein n=1 Tax=Saccharopolyspora spinosa TaxID=60894 RepID=UPI0002FE5156|nr:hypothetical protein [Saccharopolyspora spinosa]
MSLLTPKDDLATVDVTPSLTLEGEALGKWIAGREPEFAGVPPFDTEDSDTFQWEADLPAWRRVEILDERLQRDAEIRKSFRRTDALRAEIERRIEAGELPADVHTAWKWRATTDSWTLTSPSGECVEIPRPESED